MSVTNFDFEPECEVLHCGHASSWGSSHWDPALNMVLKAEHLYLWMVSSGPCCSLGSTASNSQEIMLAQVNLQ